MRSLKLFVVCFFTIIIVASAAFAGTQDFTLVNKTGQDIFDVYVTPSKSDDWGEDIMEMDVLENGGAVDISFSPKEKATYWDIMVVFKNGKDLIFEKFNLKELEKITLTVKNGNPVAIYE